jgi:plasmid maintenance system antidote protein VapI
MKLNVIKIKIAMAKECLTVKELAERMGRERHSVHRLLREGKCMPFMVGRLANALNVSVEEIVVMEDT